MTPAARLQAAIEVLDEVIASARSDGPPADTIVTRYFKQRRYAGSKDRRAVRELDVPYPVAIDNDFAIWRSLNNPSWVSISPKHA